MFWLFGIIRPRTGPEERSAEAPRKKSFFGSPVDPAVIEPLDIGDPFYRAGEQPGRKDGGGPWAQD